MRAARQTPQHRCGIVGIGGFSEHIIAEHDFGIRAEHDRIVFVVEQTQTGARLFAGDAAHVRIRRFARRAHFRKFEREHLEGLSDLFQQLTPARRLRCEKQPH